MKFIALPNIEIHAPHKFGAQDRADLVTKCSFMVHLPPVYIGTNDFLFR